MKGFLYALSAYVMWGMFPLFFSLLRHVSPMEILAYRVMFAFVVSILLVLYSGQFLSVLRLLNQSKARYWSVLSSILISINWFVFIWAVDQHRVLEASLGYFITPLVSLALGRLFLKESLSIFQIISGLIAGMAIIFEILVLGHIPWISVTIAFSFGLYGLVRKKQPMASLEGLTLETLWALPIALGYVIWVSNKTLALWEYESLTLSLIVLSGLITALPLLLFAASVRTLNLTVAGFIMYINPMLQFVVAVWILGETMPIQRYVTFTLVIISMFVFFYGLRVGIRKSKVSQ